MTSPDFAQLLRSITRCNTVYQPDAPARFAAQGYTVLGWHSTTTAQGAALYDPQTGRHILCIAGTRVTNGTTAQAVTDIWEDAEEIFANHDLGGGAIVASGAYRRGTELCAALLPAFPVGSLIDGEGHSLGGQDTHALRCILPPDKIGALTAWEPPKAGNDAFWTQYGTSDTNTVLNGLDPWAAHPWGSQTLRHPPGPILWLHDGGWSWVTRDTWPGPSALHAGDHDTDSVIRSVAQLVG